MDEFSKWVESQYGKIRFDSHPFATDIKLAFNAGCNVAAEIVNELSKTVDVYSERRWLLEGRDAIRQAAQEGE